MAISASGTMLVWLSSRSKPSLVALPSLIALKETLLARPIVGGCSELCKCSCCSVALSDRKLLILFDITRKQGNMTGKQPASIPRAGSDPLNNIMRPVWYVQSFTSICRYKYILTAEQPTILSPSAKAGHHDFPTYRNPNPNKKVRRIFFFKSTFIRHRRGMGSSTFAMSIDMAQALAPTQTVLLFSAHF